MTVVLLLHPKINCIGTGTKMNGRPVTLSNKNIDIFRVMLYG